MRYRDWVDMLDEIGLDGEEQLDYALAGDCWRTNNAVDFYWKWRGRGFTVREALAATCARARNLNEQQPRRVSHQTGAV